LLTVFIILPPKYFYDLFLLVPVQNNGVEAETFLPNIYHPPSKQLEFTIEIGANRRFTDIQRFSFIGWQLDQN